MKENTLVEMKNKVDVTQAEIDQLMWIARMVYEEDRRKESREFMQKISAESISYTELREVPR